MKQTLHQLIDYFRWGCTTRDRVSYLVFTIGMLAGIHATFMYGGIYANIQYRYQQVYDGFDTAWDLNNHRDVTFNYEKHFSHVSQLDRQLAEDVHRVLMVRRALMRWKPMTEEERIARSWYNDYYTEQYEACMRHLAESVSDKRLQLFLERQLIQENI